MIFDVALGAVLLVAAVAKLRVPGWAEQTATALRLPLKPTRAVPVVELVVGAAVIAQIPLAPLAALAMLVAYTAVLVPRIGGPPCACFGRAARPITGWTIARNIVLIELAIVSLLT